MVGGHLLTNQLTGWNLAKFRWDYGATHELQGVRAQREIKTMSYLYAYHIWILERYVHPILKVLHDRHGLSTVDLECSTSSALPSHSLDNTMSIGVVCTIGCRDFHTRNKLLETEALTWGETMTGGECVWLSTLTKEVERKGDKISRFIHGTRRDVDIYKKLVDRWSHRLKVSTPQNYSPTDE